MPFNFEGIGAALGQGLGQGISNRIEERLSLSDLGRKLKFISSLPVDQKQLYLMMGGGGKNQMDPLSQLAASILAQQMGLSASPQADQKPNQNKPDYSGLLPGEIAVKDKKSGKVVALPEAEFDPNLYERVR